MSFAFAAQHNKGRLQVNLNFLQVGGEDMFLNQMKNAQAWTLSDNTAQPEPSTLNSDGYPTSIVGGGVYSVFFVPKQSARSGRYAMTWDAPPGAVMFVGMAVSNATGSLTTSASGHGRYEWLPPDDASCRFSIGIKSVGVDNLRVFHVDDEDDLVNKGYVFGTRFKQRLVEANFGRIRFLNSQVGNTTNVVEWKDRKPLSYVYYGGYENRAEYYGGVTAGSGSAFTVNAPPTWSGLVDKARVMVKIDRSYSGGITLSVGGTAAKNVLNAYSSALSEAGNSYVVGGRFAFLVYDAELGSWIKQGGDVAMGSQGLGNGIPPELLMQLCAEVGADPHYVLPPFAGDIASDYIPSLAALHRDVGPSWMRPVFEGPNETFNTFAGFYQTAYAVAKETAYGWGAGYYNWYCKVLSYMGQQVSAVYSGDRSKYFVACGVQTNGGTDIQDDRMLGTKWLASDVPLPPGMLRQAAKLWVNEGACAQYYSPGGPNDASYAASFAAATNDPDRAAIAIQYAQSALTYTYSLPNTINMQAAWKAWAVKHGIKRLCGYEGGWSPDYRDGGNSDLDRLKAASKRLDIVGSYTVQNIAGFFLNNKGDFVADYPSVFQLGGYMYPGYSSNAWSVLEDIYEPTPSPQWQAIVTLSTAARTKRWTLKAA